MDGENSPENKPVGQLQDEQQDYEAASKAVAREHVGPQYQKVDHTTRNRVIKAVIIIAIIAACVYWLFLRSKPANNTTNQPNQTQKPAASQIATETAHYNSDNFNLWFDYPKDWTVKDESGSGKLTVTSPKMKLKSADGQEVDGQIVMMIRDKSQKLSEFDAGNATAVLDSEKIAYTKPTQTQRGSTYISFLNYASGVSGGLDAIYITGDNGYQKDQAVPLVDISKVDPVIDIAFVKADSSQLTITTSQWSDTTFAKPLKSMLQSLSIQ